MPWSAFDIAAMAGRILRGASEAFDAEQSVRGLDALDELSLHPILARGFEAEGLGVFREQCYPGTPGRPIRRDRERCDLVLAQTPGLPLLDPVARRRERAEAADTLFVTQVEAASPAGVACDEALWLEVKSVGQFCFTDGVPGPNPTYVSDMTAWIKDLAKLARDPVILHAAALAVVFAADERTLRHDLGVAIERALKRDLPLAAPAIECFQIADRIGNAVAGVAVIPLSKATVVGSEPGA
jgi:hypothetical protein